MDANPESKASIKERRKAHREIYEQNLKVLYENREEIKEQYRQGLAGFNGVVVKPDIVDMKAFKGEKWELSEAIEKLYANDGRDFKPYSHYPLSALSNWGKDWALHARGIYYRGQFSDDLVTCGREIWTPSLSNDQEESTKRLCLKIRANNLADHSKNNETWCKSEYAWEADAWSDVFRPMRDDSHLAVDKHDYFPLIAEVDPLSCKLTGKHAIAKRTPDATFGLATFTDRESALPGWTPDLLHEHLEQLMLHPKYGLFSDPKRIEADLAFPFMVYEAKGWNGDCRVARRQACSAAAYYLDMIDELVRRPGPVGTPRPYQTPTSHQYQVFALTSFGAFWHLLVGYRRPRSPAEYAGESGMSDTVYVFQKLWSGYVVDSGAALQLLSLIDQIHLWAKTVYRDFVLAHLRPWHSLCQKNYLLEWDSKYDLGESRKRKRTCKPGDSYMFPSWVHDMDESSQQKYRERGRLSLAGVFGERFVIEKNGSHPDGIALGCEYSNEGCTFLAHSTPALIDHLRQHHGWEERQLASLRWCFEQELIIRGIEARQSKAIMATGSIRPETLLIPSRKARKEINLPVHDISPRDVVAYNRPKYRICKPMKE